MSDEIDERRHGPASGHEAGMTSKDERAAALAELSGLLDAWGGDASRWPPRVRLRIAELSGHGAATRELLDEARALDRVLDRVGETPAAVDPKAASALADRIVRAALAQSPASSRQAHEPANVIALPVRARAATARPVAVGRWHAAGLLAASLLAGIYIGGSINLVPVLQEVAEAVGLPTAVEVSVADDLGEEDAP